jgi:hypothetical protein
MISAAPSGRRRVRSALRQMSMIASSLCSGGGWPAVRNRIATILIGAALFPTRAFAPVFDAAIVRRSAAIVVDLNHFGR